MYRSLIDAVASKELWAVRPPAKIMAVNLDPACFFFFGFGFFSPLFFLRGGCKPHCNQTKLRNDMTDYREGHKISERLSQGVEHSFRRENSSRDLGRYISHPDSFLPALIDLGDIYAVTALKKLAGTIIVVFMTSTERNNKFFPLNLAKSRRLSIAGYGYEGQSCICWYKKCERVI